MSDIDELLYNNDPEFQRLYKKYKLREIIKTYRIQFSYIFQVACLNCDMKTIKKIYQKIIILYDDKELKNDIDGYIENIIKVMMRKKKKGHDKIIIWLKGKSPVYLGQ